MTLVRLPLSEIRSLLFGVFRAENEPEGLFPNRMTPGLSAFYTYAEAALIRARCASGARLRFRSDASRLRLTLRTGRQARARHCADLFLDDTFEKTCRAAAKSDTSIEITVERPDRRPRLVEIWLPHVTECWITSLELDPDASLSPAPPDHPELWLAIGDSITQGMEASSPALAWPALAARALGIGLHNTAVGGAQMDPGAGQVEEIPASVLTVAFGCNDWNQSKPLRQFEADTHHLLDRLQTAHPHAPLLLLTPLPILRESGERNEAGEAMERYRETLRQAAAERGLTCIEGPSLVPPDRSAFSDGIHPNNAGMALMARRIQPFLARALGLTSALPRG